MTTNYRKAWNDWRKTEEYKNTIDAMQKQGIPFRYANNILNISFAAGWGNKPIFDTNAPRHGKNHDDEEGDDE